MDAPLEVKFKSNAEAEDIAVVRSFYESASHLGYALLLKIMSQAEGQMAGLSEAEAQTIREEHRPVLSSWYEVIEPIRQVDRTIIGFDKLTWAAVRENPDYLKLQAENQALQNASDSKQTAEKLKFDPDYRYQLTPAPKQAIEANQRKMRRIKHAVVVGRIATVGSYSLVREDPVPNEAGSAA